MGDIKNIYKVAKERCIEIMPWQKTRLDNTYKDLVMPLKEIRKLPTQEIKNYIEALYNVQNENAGGWDGWVSAHEVFEKLGFQKQERSEGHRTFVSYIYKSNLN